MCLKVVLVRKEQIVPPGTLQAMLMGQGLYFFRRMVKRVVEREGETWRGVKIQDRERNRQNADAPTQGKFQGRGVLQRITNRHGKQTDCVWKHQDIDSPIMRSTESRNWIFSYIKYDTGMVTKFKNRNLNFLLLRFMVIVSLSHTHSNLPFILISNLIIFVFYGHFPFFLHNPDTS